MRLALCMAIETLSMAFVFEFSDQFPYLEHTTFAIYPPLSSTNPCIQNHTLKPYVPKPYTYSSVHCFALIYMALTVLNAPKGCAVIQSVGHQLNIEGNHCADERSATYITQVCVVL